MGHGIRMTQEEYERFLAKSRIKKSDIIETNVAPEAKPIKSKMSKTEQEYARTYLRDVPHKFEGITLKMDNGHRYTPDYYVNRNGVLEMHEIKGSYRLGSYGRAKLAFDQAKVEYPEFKFIFATKTKDGWRFS